jgi:hypothetical protein
MGDVAFGLHDRRTFLEDALVRFKYGIRKEMLYK